MIRISQGALLIVKFCALPHAPVAKITKVESDFDPRQSQPELQALGDFPSA